jgi:thymidylate synthase ThyX
MADRRIYLLSPREHSPETIAVAFAKTSRSPESFREIVAGLTEQKSAQFHEKWVVGYGHASVAEHAVLHIAFENVSRLAIESIESNRLASYTEKSTRYQKWGPDDFHSPAELAAHPLRGEYLTVCGKLFAAYQQCLEPVRKVVLGRATRRDNESDEALDRRVRSEYVDVCRFLLPAASLANVGMTANARVLENVIRKMLSHELVEVREIGEQVKDVARQEVPTLVKYAEAMPHLSQARADLGAAALAALGSAPQDRESTNSCILLDYDTRAENMMLAAALYRFGGRSLERCRSYVETLPDPERERLASLMLGSLSEHDVPLRELEYGNYTFDLIMDQGAYAEFKRHRMMTQTPQKLTAQLGYSVPRLIEAAGQQRVYEDAMQAASALYERLCALSPYVAQYVVPNAFHRRVLAQFNLREAYAFCQLRTAPNAHFSIRRLAGMVAAEIRRVHPLLSNYMRLPAESPADVADRHFWNADGGNGSGRQD